MAPRRERWQGARDAPCSVSESKKLHSTAFALLHTRVTYLCVEPFLSFSVFLHTPDVQKHGDQIPHMQVVLTHGSFLVIISIVIDEADS